MILALHVMTPGVLVLVRDSSGGASRIHLLVLLSTFSAVGVLLGAYYAY